MGLAYTPPLAEPFYGRQDILGPMRELLDQQWAQGRPCRMYVHGLEGLGVSSLVAQFAKNNRTVIDGILIWLSGRRPDGSAVPIGELTGQALRALGVPAADQGASDFDRTNAYQNVSRIRSFMLVVDNLVHPEQILSLVPPDGPRAIVVATTQLERRALKKEGFRGFAPQQLTATESLALFRDDLRDTAAQLTEATLRQLAGACGGFPLLIKVLAAQIEGRARVAERLLADLAGSKLTLLALDDERRIANCLDFTYANLDAEHQRAYRFLALIPGADFGIEAAAVALDTDPDSAGRIVDDLVDFHLLDFRDPMRYGFHDVVRDDARHRGAASDTAEVRREVIARVTTRSLRTALPCAMALSDRWWVDSVSDLLHRWFGDDVPVVTRPQALAWFDRESAGLAAGLRLAHQHGLHELAWQGCVALFKYLHLYGYYDQWLDTHRDGLASARAAGDLPGVMQVSSQLGAAQLVLGDLTAARECFETSLAAALDLGHALGEQSALEWLGKVAAAGGQAELAEDFYRRSWDVTERATEQQISAAQQARVFALLRLQRARLWVALARWDEARAAAAAACEYFDTRHKEIDNRAKCLTTLGRAMLGAGDAHEAVAVLSEAAELFGKDDARRLHADARSWLGDALAAAGQPERAAQVFRQVVDYYDEVGSDKSEPIRHRLAGLGY